jgi:hypothetical protein
MEDKTMKTKKANMPPYRAKSLALLKEWGQKLSVYSLLATGPALAVHAQEAQTEAAPTPETNRAGQRARFPRWLRQSLSNPELLRRQSEFLLPHQRGDAGLLAPSAGNDDCPGRPIPAGSYPAAAPYTDTGDTTGANNTISRIQPYYTYDAFGPDQVYSFKLTDRGARPQIEVAATSGAYRPLIYVLLSGDFAPCPAGTGNFASNVLVYDDTRFSGEAAAILDSSQMRFLPLNVPLHLFIDSQQNDANGVGPYTLRMRDVTIDTPVCANPIDCRDFFVLQHYRDFLSRDPDDAGFAYWFNELAQCGMDADCLHNRRIGVSAAFFVESEFQEAGYFVYRLYRASYGNMPAPNQPRANITFNEFEGDRGFLFAGNLEQGKQQLVNDWVQRVRFLNEYPLMLTNADFVNRLFDRAGLVPFTAERQAEIDAMNTQGRTRAQVLRNVADLPALRQREYNPAFVLMQYFGYLRRDPDQAGYDFWLNILNQQPANARGMVCAFVTAAEYQLRFGNVITRSNADCAP